MTDDKIQELIVNYNQHRPNHFGEDRPLSWCPAPEFEMMHKIVADLERAGFTNFRYDNSREEWAGFILVNYFDLVCRIDISMCCDPLRCSADLSHLRRRVPLSQTAERFCDRNWEVVEVCRWGFERSSEAVRIRELRIDKILVA
jgi:hypothetical protein